MEEGERGVAGPSPIPSGQRLFEWDTHVHRTAASAAEMLRQSGHPAANRLVEELGDATRLRPRLDATVATAVRKYLSMHGDRNEVRREVEACGCMQVVDGEGEGE